MMRLASRRGITLIEMLIAVILFTMLIALVVPFFRAQTMALTRQAGTFDAVLAVNFGIDAIERDIRVGGVGVLDAQPLFVQAAPDAITLNGDLFTRSSSDMGAVYVDPDMDARMSGGLDMSRRIQLPLATRWYPDTNYIQGGLPSSAETISYWLRPDSSTASPADFILFRRVNNAPPQVVAKGIRKTNNEPLFRYYRLDGVGQLTEITGLPIYHTVPIHDAPADTGQFRLIDEIRVVQIQLTGTMPDARQGDVNVRLQRNVRIMNAGLIHHPQCGEIPLMSGPIVATPVSIPQPEVTLTWNASLDESGGEKDVERYVIYRRDAVGGAFGEPLASIAGGQATYEFVDTQVQSGDQWIYAVAAQDCTPQASDAISSNVAVVP